MARRRHWGGAEVVNKIETALKIAVRELKQRGRERYKIIDLITEYNDFMWECMQPAGDFPPSSLKK